MKVVVSGGWKGVAFLELCDFSYTKCTRTMEVKSKFFKKIASCSLEGNKIEIIRLKTIVIIPYMLLKKITNDLYLVLLILV